MASTPRLNLRLHTLRIVMRGLPMPPPTNTIFAEARMPKERITQHIDRAGSKTSNCNEPGGTPVGRNEKVTDFSPSLVEINASFDRMSSKSWSNTLWIWLPPTPNYGQSSPKTW